MGHANPEQNSNEALVRTLTNHTSPQDGTPERLPDEKQSLVPEEIQAGRDVHSPKTSSTGPRSKAGQRRSSRNAIKHGIFSEVILLPGEPISQYRSLLKRWRDALRPEDEVESVLVEKLVCLAWRYRRFLAAECAEIRRAREFVESDQKAEDTREAGAILTRIRISSKESDFQQGLIIEIQNPDILEQCLQLLLELRRQIQGGDLDRERGVQILEKIYGSDAHVSDTLFQSYRGYCDSADAEPSDDESCALAEQWRQYFLRAVSDEVRRLRAHRQERASVESAKLKLEVLRHNVPESDRLDRLLRYESRIEQSFDRTLKQLEEKQRQRRGEAVVPCIDVNLRT
jgi:hypothetical protein